MLRAPSFAALLTGALLVACGETHVTLLEPIVGHAGTGSVNHAGAGAGASAGTEAGGSAATDSGAGSANDASGGDSGSDGAPPPPSLNAAHLIHRYSFDGEGTRVVDSVGSADGTLQNGAELDGSGNVTLDGKDDYVNLPNGLLSGLTDATLIAWIAWNGGNRCWQRVFDFGSTDAGEDQVGNATSSLFLTPLRCPGTGPATSIQTTSNEYGSVDSDTPFPVLEVSAIAVVIDATKNQLRMYAAGASLGKGTPRPLALLSEENDWLGRSQWVQDPYLRGTYDEFRIYDIALSDAELAALEAAGQNVIGK